MAYGNMGVDSYDMNEAVRQQAQAQQQAQAAQQAAMAQQNYERQRQAFQEQMIAREQARRENESRAQMQNQQFALQQQYKKDPHAHLKQQWMSQTQNEPEIERARAANKMADGFNAMAQGIGNIGTGGAGGSQPSVNLYDHAGNSIGGSTYGSSYGRGGMSPFRQSLLGG